MKKAGGIPERASFILLFAALVAIYAASLLRPNGEDECAIRRCIWPIGGLTLLTQNLFPWYMLWLLPLLAIFLPARAPLDQTNPAPLPLDSWTGWWLFCGLVALSYTFFIRWRPVPLAAWIQFLPLYTFLIIDLARWLRRRGDMGLKPIPTPGIIGAPKVK